MVMNEPKTVFKHLCFHIFLLCFLIFSTTFKAHSQILINEFQASNNTSVPEMYDFSDYPDWVEFYNSSDNYIWLNGFTLTDDITKPDKWSFPNGVVIPAKSFFLLYLDGYEAVPGRMFHRPWHWAPAFETKYYHAPFKLSKAGEEIALFDFDGALIDHVVFGSQLADVSYGRQPDGGDDWYYFGDPTPRGANVSTPYTEKLLSQPPTISPEGGFNNAAVSVTLTSENPNAELRYTTDGSNPDEESPVFTNNLNIDDTKTVRVRAFDPGKLPAFTETQTYNFDDTEFTLPIISITTDPSLLWDDEKGIYENELKQRDIPIRFEYYLDKETKVVNSYATLRLSGQYSFQYPQKPFTITAKPKFNADFLSYPFFNNVDNYNYKSIYLRNSGWPDISNTYFRDALSHTIVYNQMNIDAQAYQPAATYLNGEFWGIYNIREKLKENYFAYHHGAAADDIDLLEYDSYSNQSEVIVNEGSADDYLALLDYMESHDLSNEEYFNYVSTQIEIDEYINYMISEIFVDNNNWQHANVKWWRDRKNGKWRWIFLDTDYAFGIAAGPHHNLLSSTLASSGGWTNFQFRKLNENESFRNEFIQRFAAYINTTFRSERTAAMVDSLQNNIIGAMPMHIEKWAGQYGISSMSTWESKVQTMRDFANNRPAHQRQHIKDQYNLGNMYDLDLAISGGDGTLFVHDVKIPSNVMSGTYFPDVPIRLKAVPKAGYRFVEWEGISTDNPLITTLSSNSQITALFEPTGECQILSQIENDLTLDASCDYYIATSDVIIHEDAHLHLQAGVKIRMPQSANLVVNGKLTISGVEGNPVVISPNTNIEATKWGGIIIDNTTEKINISYLEMPGSTKGDNNKFTGAITSINAEVMLDHVKIENVHRPFYSEYGNIYIDNCHFRSPHTTDMINIKYADTAIVENCDFMGNDAPDTDALDLDGVGYGVVRGNKIYGFSGFNSDGIDLGEECTYVLVENNQIKNISDKGISVGQASICDIRRNVIINCAQGVGVKDFNSTAIVDQNTFYGNEYAVASFEKNPGYGGGTVEVKNSILASSVISPYLLDNLSLLYIDYSLSNTDVLPGTANINDDPLFVDELIFDLTLQPESPSIDAGDPTSPRDPDNSNADMGAYYTFQPPTHDYSITINEINYHSNEDENDSGDWIELYNYGTEAVDLSNWVFMDDNYEHKHIIELGTIIPAGEYLVIANNIERLDSVYGNQANAHGNFDFGLGNKDDVARLFNSSLEIVDIVKYKDSAPWSEKPDGNGPSLMLIDPTTDNAISSSWYDRGYPTPGYNNHDCQANFRFYDPYGCSGKIHFKNTTHGITDSVRWDFGISMSSIEYDPTYTFASESQYPVTLDAYSQNNQSDHLSEVDIPYIIPAPEVSNDHSCGPGILEMFSTGQESIFWYDDEFASESIGIGNSFTTPLLNATTTYYVASVEDSTCSSDRIAVTATIYDEVVSDFEFVRSQLKVSFINNSQNGDTYTWDFGDGNIVNDTNDIVIHYYTVYNTYNVTLYSENTNSGCTDTLTLEVFIDPNGTEDIAENQEIIVYPNPFSNVINIHHLQGSDLSIQLLDAKGSQITVNGYKNNDPSSTLSLDLTNQPAGLYFLKIRWDEKVVVKRIVKK
jgi:PKD repeat protein